MTEREIRAEAEVKVAQRKVMLTIEGGSLGLLRALQVSVLLL